LILVALLHFRNFEALMLTNLQKGPFARNFGLFLHAVLFPYFIMLSLLCGCSGDWSSRNGNESRRARQGFPTGPPSYSQSFATIRPSPNCELFVQAGLFAYSSPWPKTAANDISAKREVRVSCVVTFKASNALDRRYGRDM
jgi:hypothetical protein